jgi:hypothetical protein
MADPAYRPAASAGSDDHVALTQILHREVRIREPTRKQGAVSTSGWPLPSFTTVRS